VSGIRRIHKPISIDRPGLHVAGGIDAVIAHNDGGTDVHTSVASSTQKVEITQRTARSRRQRANTGNDNITGGTRE
jgi:hypothetical protein